MTSHQRPGRLCRTSSGFTLLEMLVALFVIGVLMSLLVPAVQQSREASRLLQCKNRLHNFGVALHDFNQSRGSFPGRSNFFHPETGHSDHWSPQAVLLPHLEQTALADEADIYHGFPPNLNHEGRTWSRKSPSVFQCPSDPVAGGINYLVAIGSWTTTDFPRKQAGAFSKAMGGHRAGDFTDGMSNTAAMSEHTKAAPDMSFDPRIHYWISGARTLPGGYGGREELLLICTGISLPPPAFDHNIGRTWARGSYGVTWYNHTTTPNADTIDCTARARIGDLSTDGIHPPRSWHTGGVSVLMMDGSVRFVGNGIDRNVWYALGTLAGGEVVSTN